MDPETVRAKRIPRRGVLALLAAASSAFVSACTGRSQPHHPAPANAPTPTPTAAATQPTPTQSTPTRSRPASGSATITIKGIDGSLADLARALYGGKQVSTVAATAALKNRHAPKKSQLTVTGSQGMWHGTPIGILAQGHDLTFAVHQHHQWIVVAGWWPDLGVDAVSAGDKQFVLVMGSDARVKQGELVNRSRADSLHVLGVDGSGHAGLLGIPRDSWTGSAKINSAMVFGGPPGQVKAIKDLTGLPISYYVLTGFPGFKHLVNAFGGVTVDSPQAMPSRGIPKGTVHLNGEFALRFARERDSLPNGDFGRSADQGALMVALALTIKAFGPARFGNAVTTLSKMTHSDLPAENALQYAAWAWTIKPSQLIAKVAPGTNAVRGDQDIVLLGSAARAIFADFADGNLSR